MSTSAVTLGTIHPALIEQFIRASAQLDESGQTNGPDCDAWFTAESDLMSAFAAAIGADLGSVQTYGGFYPRTDGSVAVTREGGDHAWTILPDGRVVEVLP